MTLEQKTLLRLLSSQKIVNCSLNWDNLYALADRHDLLLPVVHEVSSQGIKPKLQNETIALISELMSTAKTDLKNRTIEYLTVYQRVKKAGYPVIVFKGIALVYTVYKNDLYNHLFGDMDIIVPDKYCYDVHSFLRKNGYTLENNRDSADVELFHHLIHHLPCLCKDESFYVEVHHRLTHRYCPYAFNTDRILKNAVEILIDGVPVRIPNHEDHILLLCYNLYKSEVQAPAYSLKCHYDLLRILKSQTTDWEYLIKSTIDDGLQVPVYYAFTRMAELFGSCTNAYLPDSSLLDTIRPANYETIKDEILEFHTLNQEPIGTWTGNYAERFFWTADKMRAVFYKRFYEYCEQKNFKMLCDELRLPYRIIAL